MLVAELLRRHVGRRAEIGARLRQLGGDRAARGRAPDRARCAHRPRGQGSSGVVSSAGGVRLESGSPGSGVGVGAGGTASADVGIGAAPSDVRPLEPVTPSCTSPKSMTRTWPSAPIMTLSGLKSRWTSPRSCAAASPRPAAAKTSSTSGQLRGAGVHPVTERVAFDQLHGDEHPIAERPHVVDHHHVRVRHAGDGLRLAQEPHPPLRRLALRAGAQELDGDLAIELRIVGRVHLPHPSLSQEAQHHESTDGRSAIEDVGRRFHRGAGR